VALALTARYVSGADKRSFYLLVHDPIILASYGCFYFFWLTQEFLEFKFNARGRDLGVIVWKNWNDPFVKIFWASLIVSLITFLIGCFHYRSLLG
jgi:hypothetical protein